MITLIEKPSAGMLTIDGVDAVDPPASAVKALRRTVMSSASRWRASGRVSRIVEASMIMPAQDP